MNLKIFLRPALTIVFGFIGAFIARSGTPPEIFAVTGDYFLLVAFVAFAALGFILPDIVELAGKAGIAALAKQIAERVPTPKTSGINVPRFPFPKRGKKVSKNINPLVVDTSSLIDARIAEVIRIGFLFGTLIVIPSVISELQRLADSADGNKRIRGRRGLDCLRAIQREKQIKVVVLASEPSETTVDDKLVKLAKKLKGKLITVDFNLGKVAKVKSIEILNINELANAVKTAVLPNARLSIQITAIGKEKNQGVGYLADGTMVVVEEGAKLKGKKVEVNVHKVLQTAAGKMIFGRITS